jgi:hypothetical protein
MKNERNMDMKRYAFLILAPALFTVSCYGQIKYAGIKTGAGITIVDVARAIEWDDMEDWNTVAYIVKAEGEYQLAEGLNLGAELGINRLYYWEYRWSDGTYSGYRRGTESTTCLGIHLVKYLGENFYLKGGIGLHLFWSGGAVAGLLASAGYAVSLTDKLQLPLALRIEPVFGNATPVQVMLGVGLRYRLF